MPLYDSEAVVLRTVDFKEADKIVTFLTPGHGRLSGLARGAKRLRSRFGASLEVLTHGRLVYFDRQGKNLIGINHFDVLRSFQGIREDLMQSASCQYLAELAMRFVPEREAAPECFALLLGALGQMEAVKDPEALLRIYEIQFLGLLGYAPRLDACVQCGRKAAAYGFSSKQGGLVCGSCGSALKDVASVSRGVIHFWRKASDLAVNRIGRIGLDGRLNGELKQILHRYLLYLLGREIRSFTFLERLRKEFGSLRAAR